MENEEDVLNMHAKGFSVNIGGRKVTASFPPPFWNHLKKTFWYTLIAPPPPTPIRRTLVNCPLVLIEKDPFLPSLSETLVRYSSVSSLISE